MTQHVLGLLHRTGNLIIVNCAALLGVFRYGPIYVAVQYNNGILSLHKWRVQVIKYWRGSEIDLF